MSCSSQPRPRRVRAAKTAKFERRYAPTVVDDLAVLTRIDPGLVDAALAAVEDLAFGRQRGKLLGERYVTGDLTGLARLRFDLAGQHPVRFRIVYRLLERDPDSNDEDLPVLEVLAIDERADHVVYRDTLARVDPPPEDQSGLE